MKEPTVQSISEDSSPGPDSEKDRGARKAKKPKRKRRAGKRHRGAAAVDSTSS